MERLANNFFDNKWVKIPLYLVSILGVFKLLEERFTEGKWPDGNFEIVIALLLGLYVILDIFDSFDKKSKRKKDLQNKIDEIGTSE